MRDAEKQGGFTLIEIIVSIILIPLLWFAVSISLSVNKMLVNQAKHRAQAIFAAQETMDLARSWGYSYLQDGGSRYVTIDPHATYDAADDLIGIAYINVVPAPFSPGPPPPPTGQYRQVTIRVAWNENTVGGPDKALNESLSTIFCDYPAAN